ncbi:glutamate racemase [Myroides marinus]|uniref:glutamate racemase n=1 Tax=Myroides marinus TaxID=703342 RepID=UPI002576275A|nr:glutamate racemase [Myroides marinus]MDM1367248.1 glutamate racemase [Myroides marinus]MDM1371247.1 glutamate racemase [Myroides marinus]MDM1374476.1 glutamate racemase [Myroides marinus]MDM1381631.1 glutamate racemase [Myroides marinus]MDM1389965.1 glutamate racemase [Myroides marinus]
MTKNNPIGIFDSGIGGTTIWREINLLMPNENTMYIGDQLYAPYGVRPKQEIVELSCKNIDYLLSLDCKIIVVACNTATTMAITEMRAKYNVPIIGIEPAIKPATILSKTSKIGILATKGTITSDFFASKVKQYPETQIIEQIGFELVTLIETGRLHSPEMIDLLKTYLDPMVEQGIDTLVLGCTHYPYLIPIIETLIPSDIKIIDSGRAVAKQTRKVLEELDLLTTRDGLGRSCFYSNTDVTILKSFVPEASVVEYRDF